MQPHMKYPFGFLAFFALLFNSPQLVAQTEISFQEHEELGKVHWQRHYETALQLAQQENKKVLLLFQEVPGCATCRNYGHQVLTHPLMVEAIETLFVPLAIFNNKKGADAKILSQYGEPAWNNPVVRIIDADGENLIPRIAGDYSALTLVQKMKGVLRESGTPIPAYLDLLETELAADQSAVAEKYFQMYCFWTGEKELGRVDGVLRTESGFINNHEVVKVQYDPSLVSDAQLDEIGRHYRFTSVEQKADYRVATGDVHYYLQQSIFQYLPLTALQQTKINSALGSRQDPTPYLSPQQLQWLAALQKDKHKAHSLVFTPFEQAWQQMEKSK